jgi:uncharacterized protein YeaO (DUF488 family)
MIQIKRTYDRPSRGDGRRILVERLWPRGLNKEALAADVWMKDVAPTTELRKWFDHRVERWDEFQRRYRAELDANPASWEPILDSGRDRTVTLLYSAHDTVHNGAVVLRDYLAERETRARSRRQPRTHSVKTDARRLRASPHSSSRRPRHRRRKSPNASPPRP